LLTGPPGCGKTTAVTRIVATVAQGGAGLIREVKSRPGVELLHLTRQNRDEMTQQTAGRLASLAE